MWVAGKYVTIVNTPLNHHVNIQVIDNHGIISSPISTVGSLVHLQIDPVFIITHQYDFRGKGETIHYSLQIWWYKNGVNEKSIKLYGDKKQILTYEEK